MLCLFQCGKDDVEFDGAENNQVWAVAMSLSAWLRATPGTIWNESQSTLPPGHTSVTVVDLFEVHRFSWKVELDYDSICLELGAQGFRINMRGGK